MHWKNIIFWACVLPLVGCLEPLQEIFGDERIDHGGGADSEIAALSPVVCMAGPGQIHVAWFDDRDGTRGIWFNRSLDGGASWMPADIRLDTAPTDVADAISPSIACTGGRVYVAWEDRRDGELDNANIYFNMSTDQGLSWLAEDIALDSDPDGTGMSLSPQLAADSSGVYVTWYDNRNGAYDIFANSSTDGGEVWLDEPARVDTDGRGEAYSASPVIVVDGNGGVVIAWEDSRDGLSDVYTNVSVDYGQSFAPSDVRLDPGGAGNSDSFYPRLTRSGFDVYVAWHDTYGDQERDIYVAHSGDSGVTWGEAVRPETASEGLVDALYPSLAAVGDTLHIAWQDNRSGGYDIWYRQSTDSGATWTAPESRMDRDTQGLNQSNRAHLSAYEDDTVLVHWEDYRSDSDAVGFNDLYYNYSTDGGTTWNASDLRINGNAPGSAYALDGWAGHSGNAGFFVWNDGRFGSADIFFNALVLGESASYTAPEE